MIDQVFHVIRRGIAEQVSALLQIGIARLDIHERQGLRRPTQRHAEMVDSRAARRLIELRIDPVRHVLRIQARQEAARFKDADRLVLQPLGLRRA